MKTMKRLLALLLALCMVMPNCLTIASAYSEEIVEEVLEEPAEEVFEEEVEEVFEEEIEEIPEEEIFEEVEEVFEEEIVEETEEATEEPTEAVVEEIVEFAPAGSVANAAAEAEETILGIYNFPEAEDNGAEMFAKYANSLLWPDQPLTIGTEGWEELTGMAAELYAELKPLLEEIAAGTRTNAKLTLTLTEPFGWDALEPAVDALMVDMPFCLYWFDKLTGLGLSGAVSVEGGYEQSVYFAVSEVYADTEQVTTLRISDTETYDMYCDLDTAAYIDKVNQAKDKAASVARENVKSTDYETLQAYADWIMANVNYNQEVKDIIDDGGDPGDYFQNTTSNPWQVIWVFDGDDSTDVVCEGYAKAFQYLCDIAKGEGWLDAICYSVSGTMTANGRGGAHMWNVVQMPDESRYLVDVTNCENNWNLFMVGVQSKEQEYTVNYTDGTSSSYTTLYCTTAQNAAFEYDMETVNTYTLDYLRLSETDYVPEEAAPAAEVSTYEALMERMSLDEENGMYVLNEDIIVTGEITLTGPNVYTIPEGRNLKVAADAVLTTEAMVQLNVLGTLEVEGTLTNNFGIMVNGGALKVAAGAVVNNNRAIELHEGATAAFAQGSTYVRGSFEHGGVAWPADFALHYTDEESTDLVTGLDASNITLFTKCYGTVENTAYVSELIQTLADLCEGENAYDGYIVNICGYAEITTDTVITEKGGLRVRPGGELVISAPLTNQGAFVAMPAGENMNGEQASASIVWNNAILENRDNGTMEIYGEYSHGEGSELKIYTRSGENGLEFNDIVGVDNNFKTMVTETSDLMVMDEGFALGETYGQTQVFMTGTPIFTRGLELKGNWDLKIVGDAVIVGDVVMEGGQLHVEKNASLITNGAVKITQGAYVNVRNCSGEDGEEDGVFTANGPIYIGCDTEVPEDQDWASGVLDVVGVLNTNNVVEICEEAHLNVYGTMNQNPYDEVTDLGGGKIDNHGLLYVGEYGELNQYADINDFGHMEVEGRLNVNTGNVWVENYGTMTTAESAQLTFAEGSSICVWGNGSLENHADLTGLGACINVTPFEAISWDGVPDANIYATYFVNSGEELDRAVQETYDVNTGRIPYGMVEYMPASSFRLDRQVELPNGSILQLWNQDEAVDRTITIADGARLITDYEAGIIINSGTRINVERGSELCNNGWIEITNNNQGNEELAPGMLWYFNDDCLTTQEEVDGEKKNDINLNGGILTSGIMSEEELEAILAEDINGWVHEAYTQVEDELVISKDFYLDDYGTIVVPDGTTLTINAYTKLIGGNIFVHQGGTLVLNNHMDIFDGTVFIDNSGENPAVLQDENGSWNGEITFAYNGVDDEGNEIVTTLPYISANWVHHNGKGWYVNNNDHPEMRGLSMPNANWRFIFFLNEFDGDSKTWERTPIPVENLIPGEHVVLTPVSDYEWEEPAPGYEALFDYFVEISYDDPNLWEVDTAIEYEHATEDYYDMLRFNIRVERDQVHGFYSAAEDSNEAWLNSYTLNPLTGVPELYYIYTDPNSTILDAQLVRGSDLVVEGTGFQRIEGTNAWKITLKEDVVANIWKNHEDINTDIEVKAIVTDAELDAEGNLPEGANTWETYNSTWGQIWWPHEHEADVIMNMDAGDALLEYRCFDGLGWIRYTENGAEVVDVEAMGFSYAADTNSLILNGVDVDGLHLYGGEGTSLNLELVGDNNYINTEVEFGTALLVAENMQLTVTGTGTLNLGGNGPTAIDVTPDSWLNLDGGTINVTHGDLMLGGEVEINGAQVNVTGYEVHVDNRLDLNSGALNVTPAGHVSPHNQTGEPHTHYESIVVGWGCTLNVNGGELKVTIPGDATTETAFFHGINLQAGNLNISGGTVTIDTLGNTDGYGIKLDSIYDENNNWIEGSRSAFHMDGGKLVMKEAIIADGEGYYFSAAIWGDGNAEFTVDGGTMELDAVRIELNGKTVWNEGTLLGEEVLFLAGGSEFVINGGTIELTGQPIAGNSEIYSNVLFVANGMVEMNGGSMNIKEGYLVVPASFKLNSGDITVTNEAFDDSWGLVLPTTDEGAGYMEVNGGNLTVSVPGVAHEDPADRSPAAMIFGTFQQNGGTVKFTSENTSAIKSNGSVQLHGGILDLSGTYGIGQFGEGAFEVSGGKLNIDAADTGIYAEYSNIRFVPGEDHNGNIISDPNIIINADAAALQVVTGSETDSGVEIYEGYGFLDAEGNALSMTAKTHTAGDGSTYYSHTLTDSEGYALYAAMKASVTVAADSDWSNVVGETEDGIFCTSRDVIITGEVTLPKTIILQGMATLTIADGAVLTIPEDYDLAAEMGTTVLVKDGGKIDNYGKLACNMGTITVENAETGYSHNGKAEVIWHHDYGNAGTITGIDTGYWWINAIAGSAEDIEAINAMADSGEYGSASIQIYQDFLLTSENGLRVSANAPWHVYTDMTLDGGVQLSVEKNAQLYLWGNKLQANGIVHVDGELNLMSGTIAVGESGILTNNGAIYNDGATISVQGRMMNQKALFLEDGAVLTVDGYLMNTDAIHVGHPTENDIEDAGQLNINGTFDNFGYLCNHDAGRINIGGTLNNDVWSLNEEKVGFIENHSLVTVGGALNLYAEGMNQSGTLMIAGSANIHAPLDNNGRTVLQSGGDGGAHMIVKRGGGINLVDCGKFLVEPGATLTNGEIIDEYGNIEENSNGDVRIRMGTLYIMDGGSIEGPWDGHVTWENGEETGSTENHLSAWSVNNEDDGWYLELDWMESWNERLLPGHERWMVVYENIWHADVENGDYWWERRSIMPEVAEAGGLSIEKIMDMENQDFREGEDFFNFLHLTVDDVWDTETGLVYSDPEHGVLTYPIYIGLDKTHGFYDGDGNWLEPIRVDNLSGNAEDLTVYFKLTDSYWTMNSEDENFFRIETDGDYLVTGEFIGNNTIAITIPADTINSMTENFRLNVHYDLHPAEGGDIHTWEFGVDVDCTELHEIETDVWMNVNGEGLDYSSEYDKWMRWTDHGREFVDLADWNLDYNYQDNILTMEGASLSGLEFGYYQYDENGNRIEDDESTEEVEGGTDLPSQTLKLNLIGDNYINSYGNSALRIDRGLKLEITGTMVDETAPSLTLTTTNDKNLYNEEWQHWYSCSTVDISNEESELILSGDVNVTVEIYGEAYWSEDGAEQPEDGYASAINGGGNALTVTGNAQLTTVVPQNAVHGNRLPDAEFTGGWSGLEGFNAITIKDNAYVNTQTIHIGSGTYTQTGGQVSIVPLGDKSIHNELDVPHTHFDGIHTNGGTIDISGGIFTVYTYVFGETDTDSYWYRSIALDGGTLNISGDAYVDVGGRGRVLGNGNSIEMSCAYDDEGNPIEGSFATLNMSGGNMTLISNGWQETNANNGRTYYAKSTGIHTDENAQVNITGGYISASNMYFEFNGDTVWGIEHGDDESPFLAGEAVAISARGDVTVNSGSINLTGANAVDGDDETFVFGHLEAFGNMVINGGSIIMSESFFYVGYDYEEDKAYNVVMNGGEININNKRSDSEGMYIAGRFTNNGGNLDVTVPGGTFENDNGDIIGIPAIWLDGTLKQTAGNTQIVSESTAGIKSYGSLELTGGTMELTGKVALLADSGVNGWVYVDQADPEISTNLSLFGEVNGLVAATPVEIMGGSVSASAWASPDEEQGVYPAAIVLEAVRDEDGNLVMTPNSPEDPLVHLVVIGAKLTASCTDGLGIYANHAPIIIRDGEDGTKPVMKVTANTALRTITSAEGDLGISSEYGFVNKDGQVLSLEQVQENDVYVNTLMDGDAPASYGEIAAVISQAELEKAMQAAADAQQDVYELDKKVTITSNLTLPIPVKLKSDAEMIIAANAVLTIQEGNELEVQAGASLTVEEGGRIANDGSKLINAGGTILFNHGSEYSAYVETNYGDFVVYPYTDDAGNLTHGNTQGWDAKDMTLVTICEDADRLMDAMDYFAEEGFGAAGMEIYTSMTLTENLTIPENVTVTLNSPIRLSGGVLNDSVISTLTVPEGKTLTMDPATTEGAQDGMLLINNGSVLDIQTGAVVNNSGSLVIGMWQNGGFDVSGTMNVAEGATVNLRGDLVINKAIESEIPGMVNVAGTVNSLDEGSGGYIHNSGILNIQDGGVINSDFWFVTEGETNILAGGKLVNSNDMSIHGNVVVKGELENNAGIFMKEDNASFVTQGGKITNNAYIGTEGKKATINFTNGTYVPGSLTVEGVTYEAELDSDYFADGTANVKAADMSVVTLRYVGTSYTEATAMMAKAASGGYGNYILALDGDLELQADQPLTIAENSYLTVAAGCTLTTHSELTNNGTIYLAATKDEAAIWNIDDKVTNNGTIHTADGTKMSNGEICNGPDAVLTVDGTYDGQIICIVGEDGSYAEVTGNVTEAQKSYVAYIDETTEDPAVVLKTLGTVDVEILDVYVNGKVAIAENENVVLQNSISLHISEGAELRLDGVLETNGIITADGTISGSGTIMGSCGENLVWKLTGVTLAITGQGEHITSASWNMLTAKMAEVATVKLTNTLKTIPAGAFELCGNANVIIPRSVENVDETSFAETAKLKVYHNSKAEAIKKSTDEYIHEIDPDTGNCLYDDYSIYQLDDDVAKAESAEDKANVVTSVDTEALKQQIQTELSAKTEDETPVSDAIKNAEDAAMEEKGLDIVTENKSEAIAGDNVQIMGALLNASEGETEVILTVTDKDKEDVPSVDAEDNKQFSKEDAIPFEMTLKGVEDPENLTVPVTITLPVPESFWDFLEYLVIFHHAVNGLEKIDPKYDLEAKTITFVVDSFSTFEVRSVATAYLGNAENTYASLVNAINAANAGDTVTLVEDYKGESEITIDKPLVINKNGKSLDKSKIKTPDNLDLREDGDLYRIVAVEAEFGGTKYETLVEAIEAANGGTVTLLRDISGAVNVDQPVTIEKNGFTVTLNPAKTVVVTENTDTTFKTVAAQASIGNVGYETLAEALEAVEENGTIELHQNVGTVEINRAVKIQTNGHNIAVTTKANYDQKLENGMLTVFAKDLFNIAGATVSVGETLDMYFIIPKAKLNGEDYYVTITKTYADGRKDRIETIQFSDWEVYANPNYYKVLLDGINTLEMMDEIYVTVYNSDGSAASNQWTDSINNYAIRNIKQSLSKDNAKVTLMVDTLNFGASMQTMKNYDPNNLATTGISEYQSYATKEVSYQNTQEKGKNYLGTRIEAEGEFIVGFAFANLTEDMTGYITYTDTVLKQEINLVVPGSEFKKLNGFHIVNLDGIPLYNGRQSISCVVKDADGQIVGEVKDSIESYVARSVANNGTGDSNNAVYENMLRFADSAYKAFVKN